MHKSSYYQYQFQVAYNRCISDADRLIDLHESNKKRNREIQEKERQRQVRLRNEQERARREREARRIRDRELEIQQFQKNFDTLFQ